MSSAILVITLHENVKWWKPMQQVQKIPSLVLSPFPPAIALRCHHLDPARIEEPPTSVPWERREEFQVLHPRLELIEWSRCQVRDQAGIDRTMVYIRHG